MGRIAIAGAVTLLLLLVVLAVAVKVDDNELSWAAAFVGGIKLIAIISLAVSIVVGIVALWIWATGGLDDANDADSIALVWEDEKDES